MAERGVKILVGSREDLDRDMKRFFEDPSLVEKEPEDVFFMTPGQFSQIFSKSRVETLKTVIDKHPESMSELVEMLKRPKESVSRDIRMLSKAGLVKIEVHGPYRTPKAVSRRVSVSF